MVIVNELKAFFRDKTNLALLFIFPILLIYLLGNLLAATDNSDSAVGMLHIGYTTKVTSQIEGAFINVFITEVAEDNTVVFAKIEDVNIAKDKIAKNKLAGYIQFGDDSISIYEGKDVIKNRTISALVTGYSKMSKAITVIANKVPEKMSDLNRSESTFVEEKEFNANRTMLDYYGVAMIAMLVFTGSLVGAGTFHEENRLKTLNRLIASPASRTNIFLQKLIGQIPSAIIEILVVMAVSVLFFNVHYAASVLDNAILFLLFMLSSTTMLIIGIVIGMFVKLTPMIVIMPPLWIMMFLGGTFSKEINIPGVTERLPIYQIQQAAFDITVFGRTEKAFSIMKIEVVVFLVMTVIGVIRFNKMKEAR